MKTGSCFAGPNSPFRRILGCMRRRRPATRLREGYEEDKERMGDLLASWGRWPGHEANFPAFSRLLWEIGKEKYDRESRIAERETGEAKKEKAK